MKLIRLKLENFQGIRNAEFAFSGHSASIYGDNATGKTTVFNALTWLLFDKASTGAKKFSPKTKNADGDVHCLDHAAEAQFDVNGRIITLRKVFHEIYRKKSGSATEEFNGHGIDYYIDGVPAKEKGYQQALFDLCGDAEKMKMLTMPDYFPEQLSWEMRRQILLEICGDVDEDMVISSNKELADLPAILTMPGTDRRYSVDDYRKIAQATKTDINKQIQAIPGRIDEAKRAMPDTTGIDPAQIDKEIESINAHRAELEKKKAMLLTGDSATAEIRQHISAEQTKLAEARAAYIERANDSREYISAQMDALIDKVSHEETVARNASDELSSAERKLARMTVLREQLIAEYRAVQSEQWNEGAEMCPSCGQRLPEDNIQRLHEEFNVRRSTRLESINKRGNSEANIDMISVLTAHIEKLKTAIAVHETNVVKIKEEMTALRAQLTATMPFEQTEDYRAITAKIEECRAEEQNKGQSATAAIATLTEQIQALFAEADKLRERKSLLKIAAAQQERIDELMASEKTLAAKYEELERGVYLCELFIKTKVAMLTERINDKFKSVRFRLFQEQLNGGVKEDCEVIISTEDGRMVPYAFANNAARTNAGLEIINTLSHHWGIDMPVFVDNAESIIRIMQMDTQVIRLVVSEPDKTLRLEVD